MLKKLLGYTFLFSLFRASRSNDSAPNDSIPPREVIPNRQLKKPKILSLAQQLDVIFYNLELQFGSIADCHLKEGDSNAKQHDDLILELISIKKSEKDEDIKAIRKQFNYGEDAMWDDVVAKKYHAYICAEIESALKLSDDSIAAKILASRQASSALAK